MSDEKKLDRDAAVLDAVYHEAGLEAGEQASKRPRTPERQAKVDEMLARAHASLRVAREQAFVDAQEHQTDENAKPVPARILAMARDAIVTRLRELTRGAGEMQPAMQFRELDELPTSDLQRILADLEDQLGVDDE